MLGQFISCTSDSSKENRTIILTNKTKGALSDLNAEYSFINYSFKPNQKLVTLVKWLFAQVQIFIKLIFLNPHRVVINTIHPFSAMLYAYIFSKEHVLYVHEHDFGNKFITEFLFYIVGKSKNIITVSESLKGHRKELKNATVIYNTHSISHQNRDGRVIKKVGLVSMGDFNKKGVYAFISLAKRFMNFTFVLQTGLDQKVLSTLLQSIELPPNVITRTSTNDMQSFYNEIDLLLNLSNPMFWVETFGLTIIEAQASGIPAIGPNAGGPTEIINDNVDGYLVDPTDIDEIEKRILSLENDPFKYGQMCQAAFENSKSFSQVEYCRRINEYMNSL